MNEIALIAITATEIGLLYRKIINIFPKDNEHILRHLSASSIHLAMFMRDFESIVNDSKIDRNNALEDKFLKDCGCNFLKEKND